MLLLLQEEKTSGPAVHEGGEEDDTTGDGEVGSTDGAERVEDVSGGLEVLVDDLAEERAEDGVEDDVA